MLHSLSLSLSLGEEDEALLWSLMMVGASLRVYVVMVSTLGKTQGPRVWTQWPQCCLVVPYRGLLLGQSGPSSLLAYSNVTCCGWSWC